MKSNKRQEGPQATNLKVVGVMLALLILAIFLILTILGYPVEDNVPLGVAVVVLISWAFVRVHQTGKRS